MIYGMSSSPFTFIFFGGVGTPPTRESWITLWCVDRLQIAGKISSPCRWLSGPPHGPLRWCATTLVISNSMSAPFRRLPACYSLLSWRSWSREIHRVSICFHKWGDPLTWMENPLKMDGLCWICVAMASWIEWKPLSNCGFWNVVFLWIFTLSQSIDMGPPRSDDEIVLSLDRLNYPFRGKLVLQIVTQLFTEVDASI